MRTILLVLGVLTTVFVFCDWRMPVLSHLPTYFEKDEGRLNIGQRTQSDTTPDIPTGIALDKYWFQGKAEISRYDLHQSRYGHIHKGDAVMVFVTEDFLTDKQVKNEQYTNPNSVLVLKNNAIRKFTTGIYEYSMMSSVFTPVETSAFPNTIKLTNTVQEWCGQTYTQFNFRDNQYHIQSNSYFENEADQFFKLPQAVLEDELFNRIRINPEGLPKGRFEMIPGAMYLRMVHIDPQPVQVEASVAPYLDKAFKGEQLMAYTVRMPGLNRVLTIVYENQPPYIIAGWTDSFPPAKGKDALTTVAKRTHTVLTDYWKQNSPDDLPMRGKLGLKKRG